MAFGESHMGKGPKLYAQMHIMICVTACTSVVVKQLQELTQPQRDHVGTVKQLVTLLYLDCIVYLSHTSVVHQCSTDFACSVLCTDLTTVLVIVW
jgi:hypothetical protein